MQLLTSQHTCLSPQYLVHILAETVKLIYGVLVWALKTALTELKNSLVFDAYRLAISIFGPSSALQLVEWYSKGSGRKFGPHSSDHISMRTVYFPQGPMEEQRIARFNIQGFPPDVGSMSGSTLRTLIGVPWKS